MKIITMAARHFLAQIQLFSHHILKFPLYPYQLEPLKAVIHSILHKQGLEILLIFPRQSGKNEAIAHLITYLLNIYQRKGGQIVYGAIGDGIGRGITRLEERLDNQWNIGRWKKKIRPIRRYLGKAAAVFLSSDPTAYARGETAHIALIVDELQDQDAAHIESVFTPMRAANNATAVYLGTVRLSTDALGQKRKELERLTAQDGIQRVYIVPTEAVTAQNLAYGAFLRAQVDKYGRNHPIIASEYFLEELDGTSGLFPPARRALMQGTHPRQTRPQPHQPIIITIDVGGQDEATTDPIAQLNNPGRDYTTATAFTFHRPNNQTLPTYTALDVWNDQGGRHFESVPGKESVASRLLAWVKMWGACHVIIDGTGVGEGMASFFAAALGQKHVTIFKFTGSSKPQLGSTFLSIIETGRFKYWLDEAPYSDAWWFFVQAAACTYDLAPGAQFDRALRWSVPNNHKTNTPTGDVPTHDDRLISSALIAAADELIVSGAINSGTGQSETISPHNPLDLSRHNF
ncbi:MAG: hypothetical protein IPL78_21275 [Chloroflexi bacterium]|nr:hypothetical protein [Chloroflexota bacterium]